MLKVCCLCPFYSVILSQFMSLKKSLLQKDRVLEMEADFSMIIVAISGYSCLTLIQNVWR